jgi:tRNA pseudouridine55 synthase
MISGVLVLDKPQGPTSHDVVRVARRALAERRIGHCGTLDPMATGVLVLGVGRATKLLTFLGGLGKTYEATIRLGVETDSLDADGEVTAVHGMDPPGEAQVRAAAATLTGDLLQVPPMVSAVKVGGRRLHQLAREGKEVERAPRPVAVARFDVRPTEDPMCWEATVDCSSGTYVRVLAADLGRALGGGAHLASLRRTAVGPFSLDEAVPLDRVGPDAVLAPATVTRVLEPATVVGGVGDRVANGAVLDAEDLGLDDVDRTVRPGPFAVLDAAGDLLAVYAWHRDRSLKPAFVQAR